MIRITKSELLSISRVFVLANTPYSLLTELNTSLTVKKIQNQCTLGELSGYYDSITSRSKRSEISMGLAYAIFIALLNMHRDEGIISLGVDPNRLDWGITIQEYFKMSGASIQHTSINLEPKPLIQIIR